MNRRQLQQYKHQNQGCQLRETYQYTKVSQRLGNLCSRAAYNQVNTVCDCWLLHRSKNRQAFRSVNDFCPNFPKFPEKFCATFAYKFSPTKIMKSIFDVTFKKGLHVFFCKRQASCFEVKQLWAPFLPGFKDFAHIFRNFDWIVGYLPRCSKIFDKSIVWGGALAPLAPPPLTPLVPVMKNLLPPTKTFNCLKLFYFHSKTDFQLCVKCYISS